MPDHDDLCPRPDDIPSSPTLPLAPPIYPASVYACESTEQADQLLGGALPGYVYQRDGHPNADMLADKCRRLHAADHAIITSSGMSAISLAILSHLSQGDHVVVSRHLYGKSLQLLTQETLRLGIDSTITDTCDLAAVATAMRPQTRMLVVETIGNPRLRVADLTRLSELAHAGGAVLLVDNTFATPLLCRPLELGADLVMESMTKLMNGHSDVMLGLLCGREAAWERIPLVHSAWGLGGNPLDCWLAARGLCTLALRVERTSHNALHAAEYLHRQTAVSAVDYPGRRDHPDHEIACRQFGARFGSIVTFHLRGGRSTADRFIAAARQIPFCPSLGEICTTLSHPASTSHRGLSPAERQALGIDEGTIRLSLGCESAEFVTAALAEGLAGLNDA